MLRSTERLGVLFALGAAFGFAFKAIFIKLAYAIPQAEPVDPITLLVLRMAFSLPAFLWVGFSATRASKPLSIRDKLSLLALGILGYYGSSLLDFIGLKYISTGLERLILLTYPLLTVFISVIFLGKTVSKKELFALAISYTGIALAFSHDLNFAQNQTQILIGAGFVFASALSFALYLAGSANIITRLGPARFTALAMLISTGAAFFHFISVIPLKTIIIQPTGVYLYAIEMAIFSTVLPVFMQSAAIARIGASRAVLIGTLGPILTIFFSWWILSEPISWAQILGAALVLFGVTLVSLNKTKPGR